LQYRRPVKKTKKLDLKRQTMVQLTPARMRRVRGGNEGCPEAEEGGPPVSDIPIIYSRILCTY
jgi:hypothetical protein